MCETVSNVPAVKRSRRGGSSIYTDQDKQNIRNRYEGGESVQSISDSTGIHEATIYKYCDDLVKKAQRRSTGRPSTIQYSTVLSGLKNNLTQAKIAERSGTTRQAVCLFIKRHREQLDQDLASY